MFIVSAIKQIQYHRFIIIIIVVDIIIIVVVVVVVVVGFIVNISSLSSI